MVLNTNRFGPPWRFTATSPWSGVDHPVSGLPHETLALFRRAFASAPALKALTSLHTAARRFCDALRLLVGTRFQVLFHSPPGVLFTFPSRYSALGGGPPGFKRDSSCPALLGVRPGAASVGLGSSPFARRYLGNRGCFLLLGVLRCFSSPGLPSTTYAFSRRCRLSQTAGSPIRTPPDQRLLTAPRGVSAFAPSFFGSQRLGIHRAPFLLSLAAWLFSSQGTMKEPRSLRIKQYAHPNPFSLPCSLERR